MKKILITGGLGFIGGHLIDQLIQDSYEIFALDNSSLLKSNKQINQYSKISTFNFINSDITDFTSLDQIFKDSPPDIIVHLAAKISVDESLIKPEEYFKINVEGTLNLLKLALKYNVKKIIFASSAAVYGTKDKVPLKEDESLLTPLSTYAVTKIAGEGLCHVYSSISNLQCICLRFFNIYGPEQSGSALVPKFIKLISNNQPITIFGDGTHTRDFIYISDVIQGITKAIKYNKKHYEIFNIAGSTKTTILDLVKIIEDTLHKKAIINFEPNKKGDIPLSFANIDNAKKELGFNPVVALKEGIKIMIEY